MSLYGCWLVGDVLCGCESVRGDGSGMSGMLFDERLRE